MCEHPHTPQIKQDIGNKSCFPVLSQIISNNKNLTWKGLRGSREGLNI